MDNERQHQQPWPWPWPGTSGTCCQGNCCRCILPHCHPGTWGAGERSMLRGGTCPKYWDDPLLTGGGTSQALCPKEMEDKHQHPWPWPWQCQAMPRPGPTCIWGGVIESSCISAEANVSSHWGPAWTFCFFPPIWCFGDLSKFLVAVFSLLGRSNTSSPCFFWGETFFLPCWRMFPVTAVGAMICFFVPF
jgi:hypothetical protein